MEIHVDIETIPDQSEGAMDSMIVKVPANYKKQEVIDKYILDNKESEWLKTSFNGQKGEIICLGYAFGDDEPEVIGRKLGESEGDMLESFIHEINRVVKSSKTSPVWVGHYITGFDLRFIWQRCVINRVHPLGLIPYQAKPWDKDVFDTKIEWTGATSTGTGTLDQMSKDFGYEGKGDIDGSKVWQAIKDGRYDEVFEYCKDDVRKARMLFNRMNFHG